MSEKAEEAGYELKCFHVPKTIDNDLRVNDHTPGYPSAARSSRRRSLATTLDNASSLPGIKVDIVMGRHAGFLTAAARSLRQRQRTARRGRAGAPSHLPARGHRSRPMRPSSPMLTAVYTRLGRCQIAASEGIRDETGAEIAPD